MCVCVCVCVCECVCVCVCVCVCCSDCGPTQEDVIEVAWDTPPSTTGTLEGYILFLDQEGIDTYVEMVLPPSTTSFCTCLHVCDFCLCASH